MEVVEGEDDPIQSPTETHTDLGNMVVLVLHLTIYLKITNILVVLDSVFCVLKAIIELKKVFIFISYLTKKLCYWSNHVKL